MKIRFSIVLPCYNVEQYIGQMLEGILKQSYLPYEVLAIDDCSTDNSIEILKSYEKPMEEKGIRYHVVHQEENRGLSQTRNHGMELATGDYLLLWDADDHVELTALQTIADALGENPATDVLIFGYTEDYYNAKGKISYQVAKSPENVLGQLPGSESERIQILNQIQSVQGVAQATRKKEALAELIMTLEKETMFGYAWNKAFRREFVIENEAKFETITHIEDVLFMLNLMTAVEEIRVIPDMLYHYRNSGQERLTGKYIPDYFKLQRRRVAELLKFQWDIQGEAVSAKSMEIMANVYFRSLQSYGVRELEHGTPRKEIIKTMEQEAQTEMFQNMARNLKAESRVAKILYKPLAEREFKKALFLCRIVGFVKRHFGGLFVKLKQKR